MTDPYKILGVPPTASDDEIKKAYRSLAMKYHPDKYTDSDLADLAGEKMKEVNAAYEEIQKMRAAGNAYGSQGGGRTGGYGAYGSTNSTGGNALYTRVRQLINSGMTADADALLRNVPEGERGAEWNFLFGCVAVRRGAYVDAQRYFDIACSLDPYNQEYKMARDRLRARANGYGGGYDTTYTNVGCCSGLDCCTTLLCADCLCRCCSGGY